MKKYIISFVCLLLVCLLLSLHVSAAGTESFLTFPILMLIVVLSAMMVI